MPGFGGRGSGQKGSGSGGMGARGDCTCVKCGYSIPKKPGTPCMQEKCPHCGAVLLRKDGRHYSNAIKNKSN